MRKSSGKEWMSGGSSGQAETLIAMILGEGRMRAFSKNKGEVIDLPFIQE